MIIYLIKKLKNTNFVADYHDKLSYRYLKNCQNILDIGCGTGRFIKLAKNKITGLDSNPKTIKTCRRQGLKVKLGTAVKIPFKKHSFEGINCAQLIEHLTPEQVYQFLCQASKILKPKGILVIQTPILWQHFYDNLTHLKPYNPQAITRYLVESAPDTTFPPIKTKYKQLAIHWRYKPILPLLYPLGIHTFNKTGYLLVLQKLK